ncbi:hypothetical protein [Saliniramus sp.]|uniref:hypothetical protein n=1 Tax=Saliniramus sp. TaxID=2986772 RepID=UPI002D195EB0|nr:hypothetical protein [Saliniramus sp.]HMB09868.1 hypothetical protein [Saliniramus sp.]
MSVIWLHPGDVDVPEGLKAAVARGAVTPLTQADLSEAVLMRHRGLVTGMLFDQDAAMALRPALERFLDAGGRWFFNGHVMRPLLDGLMQYQPMTTPKRSDFALIACQPHPVFAGIDVASLETNRGVAGFYGRGCNPPPPGAVVINTLGPRDVAVDWVWHRPHGGAFFSHAGNDLAQIATMHGIGERVWANIIAWAAGGPCISGGEGRTGAVSSDVGWLRRDASRIDVSVEGGAESRLVATNAGTYYQIEALEGPRYRAIFDDVVAPEAIDRVLKPDDILLVSCRTPPSRMIAQRERIARHLEAGGTVIAMGESRSDLWLPNIAFTPVETNFWWWLTPEADLGVRIAAPDHPLLAGMADRDVTWHLHGWFVPPQGAQVLIVDEHGRAIAYDDRVSTQGRMIVTSLDPIYHHGSRFMPATTRFLDRFLPNLRGLLETSAENDGA